MNYLELSLHIYLHQTYQERHLTLVYLNNYLNLNLISQLDKDSILLNLLKVLKDGDWVLSYNNNVLVGARKWNGSYTDIPAMGYDEDLNTAGYCETGDIIRFSLFRPSTGETFNLSDNLSPWEDNLIDIVTSLSIDYGNFIHGFELNDVYPNPFNPSTTINFTVSNDVNLSLVIYDMNGRIVDTLIDSNVSPGIYDTTWNANSFASGVYFAKLSSGAFEQTQNLY